MQFGRQYEVKSHVDELPGLTEYGYNDYLDDVSENDDQTFTLTYEFPYEDETPSLEVFEALLKEIHSVISYNIFEIEPE